MGSISFKKQGETVMRIDTYDYESLVLAKKVLDTLITHAIVIGEMEQMRDMLSNFIVKTTKDGEGK